MDDFGLQTREKNGKKRKKEGEEEEKGEAKSRYGFSDFCMELCVSNSALGLLYGHDILIIYENLLL